MILNYINLTIGCTYPKIFLNEVPPSLLLQLVGGYDGVLKDLDGRLRGELGVTLPVNRPLVDLLRFAGAVALDLSFVDCIEVLGNKKVC